MISYQVALFSVETNNTSVLASNNTSEAESNSEMYWQQACWGTKPHYSQQSYILTLERKDFLLCVRFMWVRRGGLYSCVTRKKHFFLLRTNSATVVTIEVEEVCPMCIAELTNPAALRIVRILKIENESEVLKWIELLQNNKTYGKEVVEPYGIADARRRDFNAVSKESCDEQSKHPNVLGQRPFGWIIPRFCSLSLLLHWWCRNILPANSHISVLRTRSPAEPPHRRQPSSPTPALPTSSLRFSSCTYTIFHTTPALLLLEETTSNSDSYTRKVLICLPCAPIQPINLRCKTVSHDDCFHFILSEHNNNPPPPTSSLTGERHKVLNQHESSWKTRLRLWHRKRPLTQTISQAKWS